LELASLGAPTQLVVCEKDRVFPHPRGHRYFLKHMPKDVRIVRLEGLGHIPMLEAPGVISELITEFVDKHSVPHKAIG
ncbi:alpha/beta hydrolase, partial [Mycobacterium sp. ITM-2017-0098]